MAGDVVEVGQMRVIPEAQAVVVRWPKGGMVWNRPLGLRVSTLSGKDTTYTPIYDLTRILQFSCYALTVGFTLLGWRARRRGQRGWKGK